MMLDFKNKDFYKALYSRDVSERFEIYNNFCYKYILENLSDINLLANYQKLCKNSLVAESEEHPLPNTNYFMDFISHDYKYFDVLKVDDFIKGIKYLKDKKCDSLYADNLSRYKTGENGDGIDLEEVAKKLDNIKERFDVAAIILETKKALTEVDYNSPLFEKLNNRLKEYISRYNVVKNYKVKLSEILGCVELCPNQISNSLERRLRGNTPDANTSDILIQTGVKVSQLEGLRNVLLLREVEPSLRPYIAGGLDFIKQEYVNGRVHRKDTKDILALLNDSISSNMQTTLSSVQSDSLDYLYDKGLTNKVDSITRGMRDFYRKNQFLFNVLAGVIYHYDERSIAGFDYIMNVETNKLIVETSSEEKRYLNLDNHVIVNGFIFRKREIDLKSARCFTFDKLGNVKVYFTESPLGKDLTKGRFFILPTLRLLAREASIFLLKEAMALLGNDIILYTSLLSERHERNVIVEEEEESKGCIWEELEKGDSNNEGDWWKN